MLNTDLMYIGLYYFFAVVALGSCAFVAFSRNLAHAIFMLLFALGSVAGFYAILGADFLFAAQVLIYVGGILVILIFAMMISEHFPLEEDIHDTDKSLAAGILGMLFVAVMMMVAWGTQWPEVAGITTDPTTAKIGEALIGQYLFLFEVAGVVLLVALMGATLMTRHEGESPHDNIEYQNERERESS